MRHAVDGRKFGRNTSHRMAMFRNMANSLIKGEQMITSVQKAKEVRRVVDRLITLGKKDSMAAKRLAFDRTRDRDVVQKLFGELSSRYKARDGGYTRVLKLSDTRWGDAAEMALIELVDHPELKRKKAPKSLKTSASEEVATPDPLARFKKMFSSKKKTEKVEEKKAK